MNEQDSVLIDSFDSPLPKADPSGGVFTPRFWSRAIHWLINVLLILLTVFLFGSICVLKAQNIYYFWYSPIFQIYSLLASTFVLSRVILCMFYRTPGDAKHTPTVTVVVPYKNEGVHIADTIDHIYNSRYPTGLIEVIAVDDGSTDVSYSVVESCRARYPTLKSYQFPQNRGKRDAMALGAQEASGEILVYIDSDSNVEPEGIYKLVQPFVDPGIGAVAGHITVIVEPGSLISKMESVRYYLAHRVVKAVESIFGAVTLLLRRIFRVPPRHRPEGSAGLDEPDVSRHQSHLRRRPQLDQLCAQNSPGDLSLRGHLRHLRPE
jgi:hyaluronan synthase